LQNLLGEILLRQRDNERGSHTSKKQV
jgi:hypothetical protein